MCGSPTFANTWVTIQGNDGFERAAHLRSPKLSKPLAKMAVYLQNYRPVFTKLTHHPPKMEHKTLRSPRAGDFLMLKIVFFRAAGASGWKIRLPPLHYKAGDLWEHHGRTFFPVGVDGSMPINAPECQNANRNTEIRLITATPRLRK